MAPVLKDDGVGVHRYHFVIPCRFLLDSSRYSVTFSTPDRCPYSSVWVQGWVLVPVLRLGTKAKIDPARTSRPPNRYSAYRPISSARRGQVGRGSRVREHERER
jgi:hypothetical protein